MELNFLFKNHRNFCWIFKWIFMSICWIFFLEFLFELEILEFKGFLGIFAVFRIFRLVYSNLFHEKHSQNTREFWKQISPKIQSSKKIPSNSKKIPIKINWKNLLAVQSEKIQLWKLKARKIGNFSRSTSNSAWTFFLKN